jgi:type I restriction enzyme, S subunit
MFDTAPAEWREASFSSLADYANGRAFKPEDWGTSGLPIIRIAQITNPKAETNFYAGPVDARHRIQKGDLIFSWSATLAVMRWSGGPAILNQHLFKVVAAPGIDLGWLQYRLEASISDLAEEAHGTTMKHIRKGTLTSKTTRVPPLDEQRRIAEVLRSVDKAIGAAERVGKTAASVRQCALDALMKDQITAALGETRALCEVAEVRTGLAMNKKASSRRIPMRYLRVANVQDGWFDLSDMQDIEVEPDKVSRYALQYGDVLLTEGGDYDKLGRGGGLEVGNNALPTSKSHLLRPAGPEIVAVRFPRTRDSILFRSGLFFVLREAHHESRIDQFFAAKGPPFAVAQHRGAKRGRAADRKHRFHGCS